MYNNFSKVKRFVNFFINYMKAELINITKKAATQNFG